MRAGRILDMLLVLQNRGRTTAGDLARRFEVSERTILRDVEALSEAGVPIFTTRGAGGGIELLDGFRTRLTGLTTEEAQTLFLAGQPRVAHRLGLAAPASTVRHKLRSALGPVLADQADALGRWFLHDPDPWPGNSVPHGELRRLGEAIRRRRQVEVRVGDAPVRTVRPVGLVLKAGSWHLVDQGPRAIEVLGIDDLRSTRLTRTPFTVPADFDLPTFWADHLAGADGGERGPRR